jgi:hypothetical protein
MDAGGVVRGLGFHLRIALGEFIGAEFYALCGETFDPTDFASGLRADNGGAAGRFTCDAAIGTAAPERFTNNDRLRRGYGGCGDKAVHHATCGKCRGGGCADQQESGAERSESGENFLHGEGSFY